MSDSKKQSRYAHFHPSEHSFVDQMDDWISKVEERFEDRWTDFLDPRQQYILQSLVRRSVDVYLQFDGGHADAERKRALLRNAVYENKPFENQVVALQVTSDDENIRELNHRDYLGSLLGIGIKREKTGDLFLWNRGCDLIVCREMSDYISMQLQQVKRVRVMVSPIALQDVHPLYIRTIEQSFSVASLRLDGVVSDIFRMSRSKIVDPIRAGNCRVNWRVVEDPSHSLEQGDVISLKGYGKCKIVACDQVTKKGRIRVTVAIYT